jgi:hypothetical protein
MPLKNIRTESIARRPVVPATPAERRALKRAQDPGRLAGHSFSNPPSFPTPHLATVVARIVHDDHPLVTAKNRDRRERLPVLSDELHHRILRLGPQRTQIDHRDVELRCQPTR